MDSQFVENADKLLKETEEWKKTWKHGKAAPCEEWVANEKLDGIGYCKHYVDARYRKFKVKITPLFELTQS